MYITLLFLVIIFAKLFRNYFTDESSLELNLNICCESCPTMIFCKYELHIIYMNTYIQLILCTKKNVVFYFTLNNHEKK